MFDQKHLHQAISYLGKFAKLMRMVLDHSSQELVTLEEELQALKIYMEIQQMRFNRGFEFNLEVNPSLQTDQIKVPPLLAQPFIENAIEHGFKNIVYQGKIDFRCKSEGNLIRFYIAYNGLDINSTKNQSPHESKALKIFKERLDLMSAQFKTRLSFLINDLKKPEGVSGTLIEYTLPIL